MAQPTYAVMCQVRGVSNAVVVFARFPDLQSGPRNVLASRALYPSVITDSRWNLNGVDQGPIAGVRQGRRRHGSRSCCSSASTGSR